MGSTIHIGIPTTKKLKNEFNVEWMRYGEKYTVPNIVQELPHVAFEVDDIYEAIKNHGVIIEPNSPIEGVIVAFILVNGAPIELMQYANRGKAEKTR